MVVGVYSALQVGWEVVGSSTGSIPWILLNTTVVDVGALIGLNTVVRVEAHESQLKHTIAVEQLFVVQCNMLSF